MAIGLEDQPRVRFRNNPLKVVVAQLRFPPIYSLEEPAGVAAFQSAIQDSFPIAEPRAQEMTLAVAPGAMGSSTAKPGPWRFLSDAGDYVAVLGTNYVSLETKAYTRFEDFESRFAGLLDAIIATLPIKRRLRLGLRYVDEIRHPEAKSVTEWPRFLKSDLIGIAGGQLLAAHVTQALQQISVTLPDGKLAIRHGFVTEGGDNAYIIDLDAYDDAPKSLDPDTTLQDLWRFKGWAWSFFAQSITDELAAYLEPQELNS